MRYIVTMLGITFWVLLALTSPPLFSADTQIRLPLAGHTKLAAGDARVEVDGPYRFVTIVGRTGYQPLSLKTKLRLDRLRLYQWCRAWRPFPALIQKPRSTHWLQTPGPRVTLAAPHLHGIGVPRGIHR